MTGKYSFFLVDCFISNPVMPLALGLSIFAGDREEGFDNVNNAGYNYTLHVLGNTFHPIYVL
ncbi:MAG: hypothetical protein ABSD46_03360 [Bacteroidota bacterium]